MTQPLFRLRLVLLTAIVVATAIRGGAEVAQLTIRIVDDLAHSMPARVLVTDDSGRSWLPPVATTVNIGPDTWFACDGSARLDVATGRYCIEVERGPEYETAGERVEVAANTSHEVRLHRWVDMKARGYLSGENHLHVPAATLRAHMAAEDLDFGSSLFWWNGPKLAVPTKDEQHVGDVTLLDAEVENEWGALYCVGLTAPMPVAWNSGRANVAYAVAAHAAGGIVAYQGGWSREALIDALLGQVDVINVGDNLFHRHKFMPRSRNSNLLGAPGLPTYPDTADGMLALATESYYRLLNCGLRLAAGAGSATGVKSTPAGYNRAYVRLGPDAAAQDFLAGWRAGRNFVTNGPMLFLTANGREPGDTIALPLTGGRVRVQLNVLSNLPLREMLIVVNGRRVASTREGVLDLPIEISSGAWIAAVATAEEPADDEELARYRQQSRLGGEEPTRLRFAHTSPIYVTVGGKGARVAESVAQARAMLGAFETFARKTAAPEFQGEILRAIAEARSKL